MDQGIQTVKEINPQSHPALLGVDPPPRRKASGRRPKPCINTAVTAASVAGVSRKVFPGLNRSFSGLPDPRRQEWRRYSAAHIWWSGTLMFLTRAGSRNAFDQTRNSGQAP